MNALPASGRAYVSIVVILGAGTIIHSAVHLYLHPIGWNWLALAVLTLLSGSATVKLPSVPATISISETFVFTAALLFGPAAGTLTVALDALVISLWLTRRGHPPYRIAFNVFALPAALWAGASLYYLIGDVPPLYLSPDPVPIARLLIPLFAFTVCYFTLNSWLIAIAIYFERRGSPLRIWRDNFAWLSLNYFGGASVAALLVTYTRDIDFAYLAFVLPLLAVLYFTFSVSMGRVDDANRHLAQLNTLYMSTIETLAMAIDAKDQITHGHIRRVQRYAIGLAHKMGIKDPAQISAIEAASLLHDMGKLAVPEYILNKPGRLTPAEFDKMKLHASIGADILSAIQFPYPVVPIVRHHHESWDGTGYPDRVRGSDIPIGARILAVVDCFDALTSDRPYRPKLSDSEAIRILLERRGTMYDPLVVDTFIANYSDLIAEERATSAGGTDFSTVAHRSVSIEHDVTREMGNPLDDISAATEEAQLVYDLAQSLNADRTLADACDLIASRLRRAIPSQTSVFFVYHQDTDELVAAHATGESASLFSGLRIPRGQRLTGWVAANRQSILNSDPILDLGDTARAVRPHLRSCISAPLLLDDRLIGVLTIYSTDSDAFNEDDRRILETVGPQVSRALQRSVMRSTQETLGNEQFVKGPDTLADRVVASHLAHNPSASKLSVLLIRTNLASHQPVRAVSAIVEGALQSGDLVYAYGSRELVVLLLGADAGAARSVAQRVSVRLQESKVEGLRFAETQFSIGWSTGPEDGSTLTELIKAAEGRNLSFLKPEASPRSIH